MICFDLIIPRIILLIVDGSCCLCVYAFVHKGDRKIKGETSNFIMLPGSLCRVFLRFFRDLFFCRRTTDGRDEIRTTTTVPAPIEEKVDRVRIKEDPEEIYATSDLVK